MTTSSTTFVPLFTIEKTVRPGRAEQAAALTANARTVVTALPGRIRRMLCLWNARLNDRAFLATLHHHQLGDIGMTLDQRDSEVNKPFWKA